MAAREISGVAVREASSRGDLKRFIDYPYRLYRRSEHWVAPLRRDVAHSLSAKRNPFFEHGSIQPFIATSGDGRVVGRVAAIVNGMHAQKYSDGNGFFGFFECEPEYDVARALLDAVCDRLVGHGFSGVRGPASPSMNDTSGLLMDGFDRDPSVLMPYNPPYYGEYLERYGFRRVMTMWAYHLHWKHARLDKLRRGAELVRRRTPGLRVRTLDMDQYSRDADTVLDIYNEAWSDNWGHVPMTGAEFAKMAADMKQVIDPNMVFFVESADEPVAFSLTLPNLNQALKHNPSGRLFPVGLLKLLAYARFGGIHECRMPLMGVRNAFRGRGLDTLLVLTTIERGPGNGYDACEMSWVLDSNRVLINALDTLGGVVDKEYAMFERSLQDKKTPLPDGSGVAVAP